MVGEHAGSRPRSRAGARSPASRRRRRAAAPRSPERQASRMRARHAASNPGTRWPRSSVKVLGVGPNATKSSARTNVPMPNDVAQRAARVDGEDAVAAEGDERPEIGDVVDEVRRACTRPSRGAAAGTRRRGRARRRRACRRRPSAPARRRRCRSRSGWCRRRRRDRSRQIGREVGQRRDQRLGVRAVAVTALAPAVGADRPHRVRATRPARRARRGSRDCGGRARAAGAGCASSSSITT